LNAYAAGKKLAHEMAGGDLSHAGSESSAVLLTLPRARGLPFGSAAPPPPAEQPRRTTLTRDARVADGPSAGVAFLALVLPSGNRHPDRPTRRQFRRGRAARKHPRRPRGTAAP